MDTHKLTFRNSFNHVQYIIDKQHSTGCCHSTTTAHIACSYVLTRNKWERLCWERLMDLPLADTMWMVNIYKCLHFVITYPLVRLDCSWLVYGPSIGTGSNVNWGQHRTTHRLIFAISDFELTNCSSAVGIELIFDNIFIWIEWS